MKKAFINTVVLIVSLLFQNNVYAQEIQNDATQNANILHKNGQIYLVVLVLVTIFAGILFYLIRIERKLTQLEKK